MINTRRKHHRHNTFIFIPAFVLLLCCAFTLAGCSCVNRGASDVSSKDATVTAVEPGAADMPTSADNTPNTENPTGTADPIVTGDPELTQVPTAIEPPSLTDAPTGTEPPVISEAPTSAITPTATATPVATETPTDALTPTTGVSPTAAVIPIVTETPTDAITPTAAVTPTGSVTPVVTETPGDKDPEKDKGTDTDKNTDKEGNTGADKNAGKDTGSSALPYPSVSGALSVSGTQLVDKHGNPVQLRGVSTHGIAWFPDYINAQLFRELKTEWNANIVRLAMYTAEYAGYCTGGDQNKLKKLVRDGVRYATDADLYVIIDWHVLNDRDPNTYISEAKKFFAEMSKEYASSDNVIYEICNEPNGGTSWASIKKYALEIIPVIKENNPDAVIIVGTPNWSQYVDQAAKDPIKGYSNIMYALHFYAATHKDDLRRKMTSAIADGLPVFVTEYGICDASGSGAVDISSANTWVSLMDRNGISYVCWNLSNKNETSALFKSSCRKTSGFSMDDMSDEGKWLRELLGSAAGNQDNKSGTGYDAGNGSGQDTDNSPEHDTGNNSWHDSDNDPGQGGNDNSGTHDPGGSDRVQPASSPLPAEGTSGRLSYSLSVSNSWESEGKTFFQYDLTVKNTDTAATDTWSISIPAEGSISVNNIWCASASVSGRSLIVSNESFNGAIAPGSEISGIGFIIAVE